jgi:hypothetical protein
MYRQATPQEEEQLLRFVTSTVENAFRKANMVFELLKQNGYLVSRKKPSENANHFEVPSGLTAAFLSNLGAALQLGAWERAGLTEWLPEGAVPSFSTAIKQVFDLQNESDAGRINSQKGLSKLVFETWLEHFSRSAQSELGVDVLLPKQPLPSEDFLDKFADFLWDNRRLANVEPSAN